MKITGNINAIKTFNDIKEGEVFFHKQNYVLKIEKIYETDDEYVNAVYLNNGEGGTFQGNEIVAPVDCELVIK